MNRYKGRQSAQSIERDFPHIVEMIVPLGGFGKKLDAMYNDPMQFHGIVLSKWLQMNKCQKIALTTFHRENLG
jgi:hypothetical protein